MIKKRLLITASTFPRWAGDKIPRFIYDLALSLKDRYDITVLAPHYKGAQRHEVMEGIQVYRFQYAPSSLEKLAYGGGGVTNVKLHPLLLFLAPLYILSAFFTYLLLLIKIRPQIVNIHWFIPMGIIAVLLRPLFRYKCVVTSHGGDIYSSEKSKALKLLSARSIIQWIINTKASISVVSTGIYEYMTKHYSLYNKKITVIPMGIWSNTYKVAQHFIRKNDYRAVFVGRLVEKKGVIYILQAVKELINSGIQITVDIYGDGPLHDSLRKETEEMNITSNIMYKGFVENTQIPDLLHQYDLFIGPSITATTGDREGLPVTFMEAMAAGLPVIVTDIAGVSDLVTHEETGIIVPQKDSHAIAEAVKHMIHSPDKVVAIQQNALMKAKEFDWTKIASKFETLYES